MKTRIALVAAIALLAPAAFVASIVASPASGVTPTLLARGTYEEFKESAVGDSPVEFKAICVVPLVPYTATTPVGATGQASKLLTVMYASRCAPCGTVTEYQS